MTTTTWLGKKDIEHFLYLSVTITTIYRDIAEQPKPPTLKHASRKTMSVSEALADIAQWSFFLHFVTFICNYTNFERSEKTRMRAKRASEFRLLWRNTNGFTIIGVQIRLQSNWLKVESKIFYRIYKNVVKLALCRSRTMTVAGSAGRVEGGETRERIQAGAINVVSVANWTLDTFFHHLSV